MSDENNIPVDSIHLDNNSTDLVTNSSLIGMRLEAIMNVLATQPDELKLTIISRSTKVLNLQATTKQREKNHARFTQPVTAAMPDNGLASDAEAQKPSIPNSLRKIKPHGSIQANEWWSRHTGSYGWSRQSTRSLSNHDGGACKEIQWIRNISTPKQLRSKFYDFITALALAYVVTKKKMDGGFTAGKQLTHHEIILMSTFEVIRDLDTNAAVALWKETGMQLPAQYGTENPNINLSRLKTKFTNDNNAYVVETSALLLDCVTKLIINLWDLDQKKDKQHELSATLRESLKTNAIKIANDNIVDAMGEEDTNRSDSKFIEMTQKETKKQVGKEVQKVKKSPRKNSSADAKSQVSTPKKGDQGSNSASNISQRASNKASGADKSPDKLKTVLKKGKQVKFQPTPKAAKATAKAAKAANSTSQQRQH